MFRIFLDDRIRSMVFVSNEFKEAVESNGLVGFQFNEVWDSEN
ncbi:imm11 family protein [Laceyella tengchongensis]